jgi:hypothetical protein
MITIDLVGGDDLFVVEENDSSTIKNIEEHKENMSKIIIKQVVTIDGTIETA